MKFVNYKILASTIIILILVLLLKNTASNIAELQQSGTLITKLETELEGEKRKNVYLAEQLKYVQTENFIEDAARKKLGYVQQGEVLVQEVIPSSSGEIRSQTVATPNWKRWVELFL